VDRNGVRREGIDHEQIVPTRIGGKAEPTVSHPDFDLGLGTSEIRDRLGSRASVTIAGSIS